MAGGRPKKTIDYDLVESLGKIMCTEQEMEAILGVSSRTMQRDEEFCRRYKKGKDSGKVSLRRMQWALASNSVPMAIFLGKQYLGQKDNPEGSITDMSKVDELLEGIRDSATK